MRRVLASVLFAGALTTQPAGASEHLHPLLKSRKVAVHSVALVPAKATFNRLALTGAESRLEEADVLSSQLSRAAVTTLRDRGITVAEDAFVALAEDEEGRYTIADLQGRFDNIAVQMRRKPKDVRKGRYSLGDEVSVIAAKINATAFLFARAVGSSQSGAARALSPFTAMIRQQIEYELAIVDGTSGDVWFLAASPIHIVWGIGKAAAPENQIRVMVRRALKKVPKPAANGRT